MHKEEGIRCFYRGFPVYLLATIISISFVPLVAEAMMYQTALYGKQGKEEDTDSLYEEVMEGRERI